MSSIKDKNLLFYSVHPNDEFSRDFMRELDKNPILKKQFILVCVNDPNIRIPDKIQQLNKVPVLIVAGFNRPIFGGDAVSWLKNNNFQEKANGFDYGSLDNDTSKYAFLGEEFKPSDYNQFFNNDYNHGFVEKDSILNQQFSNLKTDAHITTFDDSNEMKKDIQSQLEQRLSQLRQQRDADIPKPIKRIGGLDDNNNQQHQQPNFYNVPGMGHGQSQGNAPTYNPNPFGNHVLPQQGNPQQGNPQQGRQLPFSMPQAPTMSRGSMGPNLPFNMPFSQPMPSPSYNPQMFNQRMPTLPFQMNMRNQNL